MTIPVRILDLDDESLSEAPIEAHSLDEVGRLEPEGVYTIARTYQGDKAVRLDAHLDRLEESARLEGISLLWDRKAVRRGLRRLLEEAAFPESRFRITIPRENPQRIWLAAEPLRPVPEALRRRGVHVATSLIQRPNPRVKSNRWISIRSQAQQRLPADAYEGIVISPEGDLLEGFTSNFFAIKSGELYTAREVVLAGITRSILLEVAPEILPIHLQPVNRRQIPELEEAFLTSSSRGVVPIVRIDDQEIGDGRPGAMTHRLVQAYEAWVRERLEPI